MSGPRAAARGALPLLLVAAAVACSDTGVFVSGEPVRITLEVDAPSLDQGETHRFRIEAGGRSLLGVVIEYGDGQVDSIIAAGAQTATHVQDHIYAEPGPYLVRARAEDANGDVARDSVAVTVR